MKRLKLFLFTAFILFISNNLKAQVDWNLGGNTPLSTNFLGTINTQPLNVKTQNVQRAKLNPNVTYTTDGYSVSRNGYLLLGYSQGFASSLFTSSTQGAFSQLHLNGANGSFVQDNGYRPWMKTSNSPQVRQRTVPLSLKERGESTKSIGES